MAGPPPYYVAKILTYDGIVSFEAVKCLDIKKREEQLWKEYAEACKAWAAASKEAKASGQEYTDPKPKKPVLFTDKKKRAQSEAKNLATLYQEKWDSKQREKDTKPEAGAKNETDGKDKKPEAGAKDKDLKDDKET